jgi:uncharacterized protein YjbJ (UPF0337 family)
MDTNRVTGAAKSFAGKAEGAVGRAAGDAKTEASGRVREAEGVAQKIYGQAKDAANDLGDAASGFAQQAMDAGEEYYRDGSRAVAAKIQEQPLGALLLAGAAGFALAMMLNRPARRPRWNEYYRTR